MESNHLFGSSENYFTKHDVIAIVFKMSFTVAPRERSFTGFRSPCNIGPIAEQPVDCWTLLYTIFPEFRLGKIKTYIEKQSLKERKSALDSCKVSAMHCVEVVE